MTVTVTFLLRRGYAFAGVVRSWPSYAMIRTSSTQAPSFFAAGCRLSRPSTSAESNAGNPVRGARPELLLLRACSGLRRAAIYLAQEVVHATVTLECEASCGGALRLDKVYMHVRSRLSCPPSMYTAAELGVGICLTLLGACLLALSMVVQRYDALSHRVYTMHAA